MLIKYIVMIGPSSSSMGGIASVVNVYRQSGLFQKWPIIYLDTHVEGTKWGKLLIAISGITRFIGLLLSGRVILLHAHVARKNSFWRKAIFILFAFARRCPVIIHLHSGGFVDFYRKECGPVKKRLVRFILDRSTRIIILSSQWSNLLIEITSNRQLFKIPNFIVNRRTQVDEGLRNENANTLLFLGKMDKEKGIFDLLKAVALLRKEFPHVKLKCGGNGNLDTVKNYIDELDIKGVIEMLGWVTGDSKQKLFYEAAIYVLPSYYEGLPMGIIEAMEAGIPIVSTTVGGIPDAVEHGVEGLLVVPGDVNALTNAIRILLCDAELRAKMGAAGKRKVADKFIAERILSQLESLYSDLGAEPRQA